MLRNRWTRGSSTTDHLRDELAVRALDPRKLVEVNLADDGHTRSSAPDFPSPAIQWITAARSR